MGEDITLQPEIKKKPLFNTPNFWICLILTCMVGAIVLGEFFLHVPTENQRVIDTMSGSIITAWFGALAYFTNHTASSAAKTEIIAQSPAVKVNP